MKYAASFAIFMVLICSTGMAVAGQIPTNSSSVTVATVNSSIDGSNITALMLQQKVLMDEYAWLDPYLDDLLAGKIDRLPGFKDYVPPSEPMPCPMPLLLAPGPTVLASEFDPIVQVGLLSAIFILLKSLPLVISHIEDVLLNKTRSDIFAIVQGNPGLTVSQLSKKFSINRGTLMYHLNVLKSNGKIALKRNGKTVEVFDRLNRFDDNEKTVMSCLVSDTSKMIIRMIIDHPGINTTELSYRTNIKKSSVHWHLQRLLNKNIVFYETNGRLKRYYMTEKFEGTVRKFL